MNSRTAVQVLLVVAFASSGCISETPGEPGIAMQSRETSQGVVIDLELLPLLPATWDVAADAINNRGEVAGQSIVDRNGVRVSVATVWTASREVIDIGNLGGDGAAMAINDHMIVAGASLGTDASENDQLVFVWSDKGGSVALPSLSPTGCGQSDLAFALNDRNEIVGSSEEFVLPCGENRYRRAVLWTPEGTLVVLGGLNSEALGINDAGEVVGQDDGGPFRWSETSGFTRLPSPPGSASASAVAINGHGTTVGTDHYSSWVWRPDNSIELLPALTGSTVMRAAAINDAGWVVGTAGGASGSRPFLWIPKVGTLDLGTLDGDEGGTALDINNKGEIVGRSGRRPVVWKVKVN